MPYQDGHNDPSVRSAAIAAISLLLAGVLLLLVVFGLWAGFKAFHRFQQRADANNKVKVTHVLIRNAAQQALIVKAQNARVQALADQRVIEAHGIRKAQDIISQTLNPYYLTHEAIKAQQAIATSGRNNTVIYVPSGVAGTPTLTQDITGSTLTQRPNEGK